MIFSYEIPLLLLLLVTAAGAILVKDLMSAVLLLGSYSFFLALVWGWLGAVDVAFVEAVVGAGLATVLFLLTLFGTAPKDTRLQAPSSFSDNVNCFSSLGSSFALCRERSSWIWGPEFSSERSYFADLSRAELSGYPHSECCDLGTDGLSIA